MFQQGYYGNSGFPAYGYGSSAPRKVGFSLQKGRKAQKLITQHLILMRFLWIAQDSGSSLKQLMLTGFCSMRSYDFVEHVEEAPKPPIDTSNFITRVLFRCKK